MRPLSDRKICEEHLMAHFQWRFLRFQIEFLQSVEVNIVVNKWLQWRLYIGEADS